uniref:Uncharacterized protein n=1 Tax=Glossina austeni TaxID=7395 RepID=A0A1A9V3X5_GLOAU
MEYTDELNLAVSTQHIQLLNSYMIRNFAQIYAVVVAVVVVSQLDIIVHKSCANKISTIVHFIMRFIKITSNIVLNDLLLLYVTGSTKIIVTDNVFLVLKTNCTSLEWF